MNSLSALRLEFGDPLKGGLPDSQRAFIVADMLEKEICVLSNECRTALEIDEEVRRIKKDLDRISKEAKKKFVRSI